jgi:hypothetical protein
MSGLPVDPRMRDRDRDSVVTNLIPALPYRRRVLGEWVTSGCRERFGRLKQGLNLSHPCSYDLTNRFGLAALLPFGRQGGARRVRLTIRAAWSGT